MLARKERGVWGPPPHEEEAIFHRKMSGFRMGEKGESCAAAKPFERGIYKKTRNILSNSSSLIIRYKMLQYHQKLYERQLIERDVFVDSHILQRFRETVLH